MHQRRTADPQDLSRFVQRHRLRQYHRINHQTTASSGLPSAPRAILPRGSCVRYISPLAVDNVCNMGSSPHPHAANFVHPLHRHTLRFACHIMGRHIGLSSWPLHRRAQLDPAGQILIALLPIGCVKDYVLFWFIDLIMRGTQSTI